MRNRTLVAALVVTLGLAMAGPGQAQAAQRSFSFVNHIFPGNVQFVLKGKKKVLKGKKYGRLTIKGGSSGLLMRRTRMQCKDEVVTLPAVRASDSIQIKTGAAAKKKRRTFDYANIPTPDLGYWIKGRFNRKYDEAKGRLRIRTFDDNDCDSGWLQWETLAP